MQFNFYLFFPLLWKWAHVRLARSKPSSKRTPSSFVLPFLYAFLVLSVLLRIVTFFQLRLFDLRHEEGVFLGFFWYSNTLTRGGAVVWGVLIAYFTISSRFIAYLREHLTLVRLGWCLAGVVVFLQMFWSRLFAGGNMVETPGWSALEQTQKLGGLESYSGGGGGGMWTTNPKVEMYWYHALFHMFVLVGSPLSNLLFAFLLPIIIHSIGSLGAAVSRLLSARVWYPVSTLSWWVYLVHPAIMMKFYALYTEHIGDLPASVAGVYANVAVQLVLSFSTALVAYVFIEQPLEILLRQGEAAQAIKAVQVQEGSSTKSSADASKSSSSSPRSFFTILRSVIFVYCCLCMVYIVLHHLAMYFAVTQLAPKPYIERADALPTTKH